MLQFLTYLGCFTGSPKTLSALLAQSFLLARGQQPWVLSATLFFLQHFSLSKQPGLFDASVPAKLILSSTSFFGFLQLKQPVLGSSLSFWMFLCNCSFCADFLQHAQGIFFLQVLRKRLQRFCFGSFVSGCSFCGGCGGGNL